MTNSKKLAEKRKNGTSILHTILGDEALPPVTDTDKKASVAVTPRFHAIIKCIADLKGITMPEALEEVATEAVELAYKQAKAQALADLKAKIQETEADQD